MVPGTPQWNHDGELITTRRIGDTETIAIADREVDLPSGWQVSSVESVTDGEVVVFVQPSPTRQAIAIVTNQHLLTVGPVDRWSTGVVRANLAYIATTTATTAEWDRIVYRMADVAGDSITFPARVTSKHARLDGTDPVDANDDAEQLPSPVSLRPVAEITSLALIPPITIAPQLVSLGVRSLRTAVLWPTGHVPGSRKLPVIMNPYGGPHAQRVLEVGRMFAEAQWIADQGFCVVIADGRGSPGRGPQWERTIKGDLASFPLADQVDAIEAVARKWPADVDASRVGITGWSFGGYLAALAVLRRPDVFRAAVAGAPVTDWRWYDSAYTERYLGDPSTDPANYTKSSLIPLAPSLERGLMIIHGFADDNVIVAHSLQLSSQLTAAGRAHTFVPLPNVTHMTPQEEIAENLLRLEVEFFQQHL
jgi:dipeptidyl-peptidase-4